MKTLLTILVIAICSPLFAQITIEGNVSGADGKPPILAHAHIGPYNDMEHSTSVECSKDGHYTIHVAKPGVYSLRLSAVNHEEASVPLIVDEEDNTIVVNVR